VPAVPDGLLENLPKAVLAAVVLTAILGLFDFRGLLQMWHVSRIDFYAAAAAIAGVLLLGILQGVLLAAVVSILLLLARASLPHVAFLGRIPGTSSYSDLARHPENEPLMNVIAFRPEASLLYVNAGSVFEAVMAGLPKDPSIIRTVVCDPFRIALSRSGRRAHVKRALRRACRARHRVADHRSTWPRARSAASVWSGQEGWRARAHGLSRRRNYRRPQPPARVCSSPWDRSRLYCRRGRACHET
jgi:MFS superfamily sulfate permease-like transporter